MGEAKKKAAAGPKPVTRPTLEIIRLKQTVQAASEAILDEDSKAVLTDMAAALAWIDYLEKDIWSGNSPVPKLDA